MSEFVSYAPGTPCWIDLATTDPARAKAFYAGLFAWDFQDMPMGEAGVYSMCLLRGKPVAALFAMDPAQRAQGVPPFWSTYVTVADVDESVARVKGASGGVVQAPSDVMDAGRVAVVQDPTGAVVTLWQPRSHIGASLANEPGSLIWNELLTDDTGTAQAFYQEVLGWKAEVIDMPTGPYTSFKVDGHDVAGMMAIREDWGPVPPHWAVYLSVDSCDRVVAGAAKLGGAAEVPPTDIAEVGRLALLRDPQGAMFYILEGFTG